MSQSVAGEHRRRRHATAACRVVLLLAALVIAPSGPVWADQPVKTDLTVNTSGGYARLVFRMAEDVDADVRTSGPIIIISFKKPIDVTVDRLSINASDYISAARRDPDGKGIRIAMSRKLTVNTMAAGERLFVDLLPANWTGLPPGLPQDVVEDLARRAREAERKLRQQQQIAEQRRHPPIRVRAATHPTFTRYVFPLPELIPVQADRGRDRLTLTFDAPLKFDLADVQADLPDRVETVEAESGDETARVRFGFGTKADVRFFREDNNYVVDVSSLEKRPNEPPLDIAARVAEAARLAGAPETAPAKPSAAAATPAVPARAPAPANAPPAVPAAPAPGAAIPAAFPAAALPQAQSQTSASPAAAADPAPAANVAAAPAQAAAPAIASAPGKSAPAPVAAPAVPSASPAMAAPPAVKPPTPPGAPALAVEVRRQSDGMRLIFPFSEPVAAAAFRRADTFWLVFDTPMPIDFGRFNAEHSGVRIAGQSHSGQAQIVRIKLDRPQLVSLVADGPVWTAIIGETAAEAGRPIGINRNVVGAGRASVIIPIEDARSLHRLSDPDAGDTLLVATATAPVRALLKTHDFVEFRALASSHGVVVQPLADDLHAELGTDKVVLSRPGGLTLSSAAPSSRRRAGVEQTSIFDTQLWGFDRQADYVERQTKLLQAASDAPENRRTGPRLELARFYMAHDMYPEAKGVLDVALADEHRNGEDPMTLVLRAISNIMMDRPERALKDLGNPTVGNQFDAPLWRALAHARQGKWSEAREGFRNAESSVGTLPAELQRLAMRDAIRASIEVRDFAGAADLLEEFEAIGVPPELAPSVSILSGRLAEGLGRSEDALAAYRTAAEAKDRSAAAQGRLREIALRHKLGDLKPQDVIGDLEKLTTTWRGDATEIEALAMLARLYTDQGRYRDAFVIMRTALMAHADSETTRRIYDDAAATFEALFLSPKGDNLAAIDALSLFYDFRELTPIGRRGDEMIRRLADRLVSVDLLDQAAELLQHQVDHRLQGAARAQVAVRLAVVYLMNRKPERALATLRSTRTADLSNELRNQRLLLEARALSDTGRHDVALEVIANLAGGEANRLRSDVLWAARRWREASEQIELLYGDRWRHWEPLTDVERSDILRAAIGYGLAEDSMGLGRFREKYAGKMVEGADRRAFEIASSPHSASNADFRDIARMVSAIDTLEGFLRTMRARYPDTGAMGASPGLPPALPGAPPAPAGVSPDQMPTGSIRSRTARAEQALARQRKPRQH